MRRLATLAAAFTLLTAAPASAETFSVNTNADVGGTCGTTCSIRGALTSAFNNGPTTEDLIVVPANPAGYTLASGLLVNSRVIVRGAGARTTRIIGNASAATPIPVFQVQGVQATFQNLAMVNGRRTTTGGNLLSTNGNVLLDHVQVTGGFAVNGGGIANADGSMTIRNSLIDNNTATGGAAAGQGGGIISTSTGQLPASLTVEDSTVTLNDSSLYSAIRVAGGVPNSTATLTRVTVARNTAGQDSAAVAPDAAGAIRVRGSILSANEGDSPGAHDCAAPLPISDGGNLETEADCGFVAPGDLQNAGPAGLSATLENQGGQTDVFAIAANSPAVNRAGACVGADQRDLPRPQGGACDSGAFEVDQAPDTTVVATPPTFTFSSSEPGVRFECRLDRPSRTGAPFACSSPASFPDLPPGSYTLVVRAIDGTGNADPSPATAAFAVQVPRPNAGRTVVVNRVRGRVLVKVPGGRFVNLSRITEIPDGSIIDTRNGVVVLVFEPRRGAKTQKAKFWDGLFKVDQRKRVMELALVEKLARCQAAGDANAAARRKKRRLWGDGKGRFRTRGKYSSATVRGTRWLTQDSCAGTLTKVRKGKVDVRDFVRKRTIRVKKGQQYLARP